MPVFGLFGQRRHLFGKAVSPPEGQRKRRAVPISCAVFAVPADEAVGFQPHGKRGSHHRLLVAHRIAQRGGHPLGAKDPCLMQQSLQFVFRIFRGGRHRRPAAHRIAQLRTILAPLIRPLLSLLALTDHKFDQLKEAIKNLLFIGRSPLSRNPSEISVVRFLRKALRNIVVDLKGSGGKQQHLTVRLAKDFLGDNRRITFVVISVPDQLRKVLKLVHDDQVIVQKFFRVVFYKLLAEFNDKIVRFFVGTEKFLHPSRDHILAKDAVQSFQISGKSGLKAINCLILSRIFIFQPVRSI